MAYAEHIEKEIQLQLLSEYAEIEVKQERFTDFEKGNLNIKSEHIKDDCVGADITCSKTERNSSLKLIEEERITDFQNTHLNSKSERIENTGTNISCIKTEEITIKDEPEEEGFSSTVYQEMGTLTGDKDLEPNKNLSNTNLYGYTDNPSEFQRYKCTTCNYSTSVLCTIKGHVLIHLDPSEKIMYNCDKCDYKSHTKYKVKRHSLVHKNPSEVEMYACDSCEFKTKWKIGLKRHSLVHKSISEVDMYGCEECDFRTKRLSALKRHRLVHKKSSDVVMYKCNKCNFKSKTKTYFKKHVLVHKDDSDNDT